jgi:hypothetical protein
MPREAKATKRRGARNVLAGLAKHFEGQTLKLGGPTFSPEQLRAVFQGQLDAIAAVDTARAGLSVAVANERKAAKEAHWFARRLKMYVLALFGSSAAEELASFGWQAPKKPGPKTVMAKLEGAVKARSTRVARRTMGKRQRKKIRGSP